MLKQQLMEKTLKGFLIIAMLVFYTVHVKAELTPLGIALENYEYTYPVKFYKLTIDGQLLNMAYMDIKPSNYNGKNVLLLHGKNFFGDYWSNVIKYLSKNGFRVIVPDQIGFGKSSKPDIHYSFHLLASNTKDLLDSLNIKKTAVIGHSMGGMLAIRFSLIYPNMVSKLILENPIGLEDYRIYIPYKSVSEIYKGLLNQRLDEIITYHKTYYTHWKKEFELYPTVQYRITLSGEYPRAALSQALTYDMIYREPVIYEISYLKPEVLLIVGKSDRTTIGRDLVDNETLRKLGNYPILSKKFIKHVKNGQLLLYDNIGHIPHLENKETFNRDVLKFLSE